MKLKNIAKTVALSGISFLAASNACAQFKQASINTMESTFRCIPDSQKIAVYWYWMSDNISKEGVVKDLQAMKRVGINRVQIGNIGSNDIAYGKVKFYSPEWWEVLHTALKTAGDLGIEVGIFNSPGWSQSGGPWVKANQAMRYLAESRTNVTGGKLLKIKLPEVGKEAEDVKVLAFPDLETPTSFKAQQEIGSAKTIDFHSDKPATVRSITFECKGNTFLNTAALYAKIDNEYKFIRNITLDRRN
ncbi:MAG: glycosyl hydrolase, partial [Bacteroidaceae bacterium]|nr:glycosyl hydrolase [Bacteroidaceae bacterium]